MPHEQAKEELFNQWFSLETIKGDSISARIRCSHGALRKHFRGLYQKYTGLIQYEAFMAECMYWTFDALHKFTLQEKGDTWDGLVDGTDDKNLARLTTYIKSTVEAMAMDFVNPNSIKTSRSVDGEKTYIRMVFRYTSIDAPAQSSSDSPEENLMDSLGNDSNLFAQRGGEYQMSEFEEWFLSENENFLTKKQAELIKILPETLNDGEFSFNSELIKTEANIKHRKNLTHYLNRIRATTQAEWEANQKEKTTMPRYYTERDNKLKTYIDLIDNEETTDADIQKWIVSGCQKEEWLEDVIQKGLKMEHLKNLNRCIKGLEDMKKQTLYAVNENLFAAVESLEKHAKTVSMRAVPIPEKKEKKIAPQKKQSTKNIFYFDAYGNEIQYRDFAEKPTLV